MCAKKIVIKKIDTSRLTGNASAIVNTYSIIQDDKEVLITCTTRFHGTTISLAGETGILYVNSDDNLVHRQIVALSGACGLNTDDEVVNGLSHWALRGITLAEANALSEEIEILVTDDDTTTAPPEVFVNGERFSLQLNTSSALVPVKI